MSDNAIVIFHKPHPLDPTGIGAGAEMATILLARALVRRGFRVYVGAQLPEHLGPLFMDCGVTYITTGPDYDTGFVYRVLRDDVGLPSYQLIVASHAQALLESRHLQEVRSRIFISHEPANNAFGASPDDIAEQADFVVCVSEAQKAKMSGENVVVIPNGADHEIFRPGDVERRQWKRIVFAGALVIDKGIHHLIEAFSFARQKHPDACLDIYGSAAMWGREDYFPLEQAKSVPGITFYGARPQQEIAKAFSEAGLLVLPSIYFDSFPLTVVEAQVCGLPVLGSTIGGMKEIIEEGVTGRLIEGITTEKLTAALIELLSQPEKLQEMSQEALLRIRPRYSWDRTAEQIEQLLHPSSSTRNHLDEKAITMSCEEKGTTLGHQPTAIQVADEAPSSKINNSQTLDPEMNKESKVPMSRIALLTTYNQACGLATYARYLGEHLPEHIIFAEDTSATVSPDEPFVKRVWKRHSSDFRSLENALDEFHIKVLHLNCHPRFFDASALAELLRARCRAGLKVILQIHNPFTLDEHLQTLIAVSDEIVVHKPENALEIIANGGRLDQISVIEHGVKQESPVSAAEKHQILGLDPHVKSVVCFGFMQRHKGFGETLLACQALISKGLPIHLFFVGGPHKEDPTSIQFFNELKQAASSLGQHVSFIEGFSSEDTVRQYLSASDAVVMNYQSQYFEASGAAARALGCGAALITSTAPAFASLGAAAFKVTTGFPLELALEQVLFNEELNKSLRIKAQEFAHRNSWKQVAKKFAQLYRFEEKKVAPLQRVLMQNRPNALSHPGGDTVVMNKLAEGLRRRGVEVTIDVEGKEEPKHYDLVHLYNFATPDITEHYAKRCVEAEVPYLVTTMYEDLPLFQNQMYLLFQAMEAYVKYGQPQEKWEELVAALQDCPRSAPYQNTFTAEHAEILIASGAREKVVLHRDYPQAKRIETYELGCEVSTQEVSPTLFEEKYGIKDFILCVGRLETRKNQLMLLKALETSELPVVLAGGGFTYQPEYEALCRAFKRTGQTIIVGRLEPQMLASAYSAARVHALPSWYELPGIVSMEAARRGKNIVVSDYGTARDYFGDLAYYCEPHDAEGIYSAVMAAYYAPTRKGLAERVEGCSWDNAAKRVFALYQEVLESKGVGVRTTYDLPEWSDTEYLENDTIGKSLQSASDFASEATGAVAQIPEVVRGHTGEKTLRSQVLCDEADELVASGETDVAFEKYNEAITLDTHCTRAYRGCAVVALQGERHQIAKEYFERALRYDPQDKKAQTGVAVALSGLGKHLDALPILTSLLDENPAEMAALLHLIPLCYALNRFEELERALTRYLELDPENLDIRYSLAGCLYKQGRSNECRSQLERILSVDSEHERARELMGMLNDDAVEHPLAPSGFKIATVPPAENTTSVSVEQLVRDLEQEKEGRNYQAVVEKSGAVIQSASATTDQISHALVLKAEALACSGSLEDADSIFARVEESRIFAHRALAGRGAVAAALNQVDEAEEFFNAALTRMPEYDVAIAGLGDCALQRGDQDKAWKQFCYALKVNPENRRSLFGVIDLGYKLGKLEDIEKYLRTYLDYHPANLPMLYSLAGCLFAQNRLDEAKELVERVLLFDPEDQNAKELLERIDIEQSGMQRSMP